MFKDLLIDPNTLSYKQYAFSSRYLNETKNYCIRKEVIKNKKTAKHKLVWVVDICYNGVKIPYSADGIKIFSGECHISFDEAQNIFANSLKISAPTLKQAHQKIRENFENLNIQVSHSLQRSNSSIFTLYNSHNLLYLPCLNIVKNKNNVYHFNDTKSKDIFCKYGNSQLSFSTKPQVVRFLYNFVSKNLYELYTENKKIYQILKSVPCSADNLWWMKFLKDEVDLKEVFK